MPAAGKAACKSRDAIEEPSPNTYLDKKNSMGHAKARQNRVVFSRVADPYSFYPDQDPVS